MFTDRASESSAFAESLAAQRAYIDSEDTNNTALRNILVYYGLGGIGKTTLSERLEDWVREELPSNDAWGPPPRTAVAATCRIDLHPTNGRVDLVKAVVAVRRAFGMVKKQWPAFDLAFAAYWASMNPGEPLPGAGTSDTLVADGIADSLGEVLSEFGFVPGAGMAIRGIRKAIGDLRGSLVRRRLFGEIEDFEDLLEQCANIPSPDDPHPELLGDIVSLLDYELSAWAQPQAPLVVTFVDTFERVTNHPRRTDEAALNEMVWRMPNVLFVITGRSSLDWWDSERTDLFAAGTATWPGLRPGAEEEPRQHLVGDLAMDDRLRIIDRACDMYELEISSEIATELATASKGLPQYLDLALSLARNKKAEGLSPVNAADVSGSLNDLVQRVLEDVPPDEQRALRAASLFPVFDVFLVARTADTEPEFGCAKRALGRPMINERGAGAFPYSMHDAVRVALRSADHRIPHGWSDLDWRAAGERGLEAVRERYDAAAADADAVGSLEALRLAIALVSEQELTVGPAEASSTYEDWLSRAIVYGPSIVALEALLPSVIDTDMGRGIGEFVRGRSATLAIDDKVALLTKVFESTHPLRLAAGRHRGYVLRNASRWNETIEAFDKLVAASPTPLNRYQRALSFATMRRFATAIAESTELPESRRASIEANCRFMHGRPEGYMPMETVKLADLTEKLRQREVLEKEGAIYRWSSLCDGAVDEERLNDLAERAEAANHAGAARDVYLARLLSAPHEWVAREDERHRFEMLDRSRNEGEPGWRTAMASLVIGLWCDNRAALAESADVIRMRKQNRGRLWIPVECMLDSHGFAVEIPNTEWLEPYDVVRDRWRGIFDDWLARSREQV